MGWKGAVGVLLLASSLSADQRLSAPDVFGRKVEAHVRAMYKDGYAKHLNKEDLFHGHLSLAGVADRHVSSLEEALNTNFVIMYHTDESLRRWRKSHTPRSIVGYSDGAIIPANFLVKAGETGTITMKDLVEQANVPINAQYYIGTCRLDEQFSIEPSATGKYSVGKEHFDVVFHCKE